MTFAEKLKQIRKQAGMSQEQLAEKLGVSRQAVTKWETDGGIPDIENLIAVSTLFSISIDELLSNEKGTKKPEEYLFESLTEYDIDEPKRYDMKFGGAKQFVLSGYEGEKIRVRLASDTYAALQTDFKVRIDMEVVCRSLHGEIAINQVSATSRIRIPEGTAFTAVTKGIGTSISYEKDGKQTERFDTPDADNVIALNGMKSGLVICAVKEHHRTVAI